MKKTLVKIAIALLATVGLGAGSLIAAAPANAYVSTSKVTVKAGSTSYTFSTYNTSMSRTKVNAQCFSQTWWTKNTALIYKTSNRKVAVKKSLEFYHAEYVFNYYILSNSHRKYSSLTAFKKDFARINALSLDKVKTSIGIYCLRDQRVGETKGKVANLVKQMDYYIKQHPSATGLSLSLIDVSSYETYNRFKQQYALTGTPADYQIIGYDNTDGYKWVYDSATKKYTESKL